MSRRQLFTVTFLLVFLLLLWELGLILRPFFSPILWAVILATTTYPLYIRLLARVGHRENIAAAIMTAGVLITAVLPAVYGMILAGQQGVEAYEQASEWLKGGHLKDLGALFAKVPGVGGLSQELVGRLIVAGSGQVEAFPPGRRESRQYLSSFARGGFCQECAAPRDGLSGYALHVVLRVPRRTSCVRHYRPGDSPRGGAQGEDLRATQYDDEGSRDGHAVDRLRPGCDGRRRRTIYWACPFRCFWVPCPDCFLCSPSAVRR